MEKDNQDQSPKLKILKELDEKILEVTSLWVPLTKNESDATEKLVSKWEELHRFFESQADDISVQFGYQILDNYKRLIEVGKGATTNFINRMTTQPVEKAFLINFLQFTGHYLHSCLEVQNDRIDVSKYVDENMLFCKEEAFKKLKKLNEGAAKRVASTIDAFFEDYSVWAHCFNNLSSIKRGIGGPPLDYPGYSDLPEFRDLWQVLTERCYNLCPYKTAKLSNLRFDVIPK